MVKQRTIDLIAEALEERNESFLATVLDKYAATDPRVEMGQTTRLASLAGLAIKDHTKESFVALEKELKKYLRFIPASTGNEKLSAAVNNLYAGMQMMKSRQIKWDALASTAQQIVDLGRARVNQLLVDLASDPDGDTPKADAANREKWFDYVTNLGPKNGWLVDQASEGAKDYVVFVPKSWGGNVTLAVSISMDFVRIHLHDQNDMGNILEKVRFATAGPNAKNKAHLEALLSHMLRKAKSHMPDAPNESSRPDEPAADPLKDEAKEVRRKFHVNPKVAVVSALLILALSAGGVAYRKTIKRTSRKLYAKMQLLVDDLKKQGWFPGRPMTPQQKLTVTTFAAGVDPREAARAVRSVRG